MQFHPILTLLPIPIMNIMYGFSVGLQVIPTVQLGIVLTSILYWTNLDNSKFRILDIIFVISGIVIHYIYCYKYNCILASFIMLYCMGTYKLGVIYNSNFIHAFVWIIGYLGNYVFINHYENMSISLEYTNNTKNMIELPIS